MSCHSDEPVQREALDMGWFVTGGPPGEASEEASTVAECLSESFP